MNCGRFIAKPGHTNSNIFFVFSSSDNHNIILLSVPHFRGKLISKHSLTLCCIQAVICIHITIMNARDAIINNVCSHKAFSSYKCTYLTHFHPYYALNTPPLFY